MPNEFKSAIAIAGSGMKAQAPRLRVISENLANADSLPTKKGAEPYRRKTITFKNALDRELGADKVKVDKIAEDTSEFLKKLDPGHPAADEDGYVLTPNVNPIIEMMDMREAQRSYEANLSTLNTTKTMMRQTLSIIGN